MQLGGRELAGRFIMSISPDMLLAADLLSGREVRGRGAPKDLHAHHAQPRIKRRVEVQDRVNVSPSMNERDERANYFLWGHGYMWGHLSALSVGKTPVSGAMYMHPRRVYAPETRHFIIRRAETWPHMYPWPHRYGIEIR